MVTASGPEPIQCPTSQAVLCSRTAAPTCISGRTSYLRVRLAFHPYPQVIPQFCNTGGFGPRRGLTRASPCPWVAHPVSGLLPATLNALFRLAFAQAPRLFPPLNLPPPTLTRRIILQKARRHPARPDRSPPEHFRLRLLVGVGVQVLFHPPRGVLFTLPSRYSCAIGGQEYSSLGGWSPLLPTGFLVSRGTQDHCPECPPSGPPTGLSPPAVARSSAFGPPTVRIPQSDNVLQPRPGRTRHGLGCGPSRSPLLRASRT